MKLLPPPHGVVQSWFLRDAGHVVLEDKSDVSTLQCRSHNASFLRVEDMLK